MRVVVAMSGGVDSSTAAGLMVEAGHEVIGLAMKTHGLEPRANRACCTPDDMRDARRVADILDIPFYVLNYEDLFREAVIIPFAQAYEAGVTPNPCVECNDKVKFKPLLERAQLLGADALATGHYARIVCHADGSRQLQRAVDNHKDQSYFLYRLAQEQLKMLMFPLGEMTKDVVREHARRMGLPTADKSESQEICFVGPGGYAETVEKVLGTKARPGPVLSASGEVLGHHDGVHHFTLGQRRGLGISSAQPLYVTDIDAETATVHAGSRADLLTDSVELEAVMWSAAPPNDGDTILIQQRYRGAPRPARLECVDARRVRAHFLEPEMRGAPGQAAVIFRDDVVLGGGVIGKIGRVRPARATAAQVSEGG